MLRLVPLLPLLLLTVSASAQESGQKLGNRLEVEGTVFKNYEDAAIFLRGLTGADFDSYGGVVLNKDGGGTDRHTFRLSDVTLSSKEYHNKEEYKGGEIGPRLQITMTCKRGPCIKDPGMREFPAYDEGSFFIFDIPYGRKVFATLEVMQRALLD